MKAKIYNLKNEVVGDVDLAPSVFAVAWKPVLVQQALIAQAANSRRPWAHVKDRSEVRGGGRKPWRQKGTGRARHGSNRSPIWVGGGKAHGPRNDKDYSQKLNKSMRRIAILSILSKKYKDEAVRIVENFNVETPKTKLIFSSLALMMNLTPRAKKLDTLIIRNKADTTITRIARNLVKTKVVSPESLNVYDLTNHKNILVDAGALKSIEERYAKAK